MTVAEMLERMSGRELEHWRILDEIDPIGPWRDDFRVGTLIADLWKMSVKNPDLQIDPRAFIPEFDTEPPDPAERRARVRLAAAALQT